MEEESGLHWLTPKFPLQWQVHLFPVHSHVGLFHQCNPEYSCQARMYPQELKVTELNLNLNPPALLPSQTLQSPASGVFLKEHATCYSSRWYRDCGTFFFSSAQWDTTSSFTTLLQSTHQLPTDTWQTCCGLLCTLVRNGAGAGEQGQTGRRRFQDSFLAAGADSVQLRVRSRGRIRGILRTRCCTSAGASQHCYCLTQHTFRAAAATRYQDMPLLQIFCRWWNKQELFSKDKLLDC